MLENGAIYCLVERKSSSVIEGIQFDLAAQSFFILLATGNEIRNTSVGYHGSTGRVISPRSVLIREGDFVIFDVPEDSRLLIILHGSFMTVAWICLTSIGIITARYFKKTFGDVVFMKKDIWFHIHRLCMTLTLILTIAAVTIIWIDVGTWRSSWHSIMGMTTAALCFWQGFMSIFRPAPNDPQRPVFNFMHGTVGKFAHILGGKILEFFMTIDCLSFNMLNSDNDITRYLTTIGKLTRLD